MLYEVITAHMSKVRAVLNPRTWPLRVKLMLFAVVVACGGVWGFASYAVSSLQTALQRQALTQALMNARHVAEDT